MVAVSETYVIEDRGYKTPCWIWQGGTNAEGTYGRTRHNGRQRPAHRAFFEAAFGPLPEGYEPDHLCRTTLCVNPEHLEAVTRLENVRRSSATKLTEAQVAEIRAVRDRIMAAAPPTQTGKPRRRVPGGVTVRRDLAAQYGITPCYVKQIWGGHARTIHTGGEGR